MSGAGRPRLAVIGSLNADLTLLVGRLPGPGETVLSSAPGTVGFGGKGGNQAAAAAAFGADVTMIARVGDDDIGEQIRGDLRDRGVDVSQVRTTPGARSGGATIAVDPSGENLILVDPGANGALMPGDIDPDALASAGAVLLQLEIPLATVAAAALKATAPVVLNPAPAAPLGPDLLAGADVLVPNRTELALLAGAAPPSGLPASVALARRLRAGLDVVVTLGTDGALVIPGSGGPAAHIAAPAVRAVDATGAGDCFCGTLAVLLAEGVSLADAARISVAAAALSVTATGARGLLPGRGQAEALAARLAATEVPG
ncbi:MAG TPA: ribokinase [Streptosporangiaceae bacterium]|nr:ribokinase [Streptosporangiaceae bacterium]